MTPRRFPPPRRVDELAECLTLRDANGLGTKRALMRLARELGAAWEVESRSEFSAEEHRERARQCLYLARQMADSPSKAMLLHMAQVWVKLAEALERSDAKSETELQTRDLFDKM